MSVVGVGFAFGYLTNYLVGLWDMDFLAQAEQAHSMVNTPLAYASSMLLAGLMTYVLAGKVRKSICRAKPNSVLNKISAWSAKKSATSLQR